MQLPRLLQCSFCKTIYTFDRACIAHALSHVGTKGYNLTWMIAQCFAALWANGRIRTPKSLQSHRQSLCLPMRLAPHTPLSFHTMHQNSRWRFGRLQLGFFHLRPLPSDIKPRRVAALLQAAACTRCAFVVFARLSLSR